MAVKKKATPKAEEQPETIRIRWTMTHKDRRLGTYIWNTENNHELDVSADEALRILRNPGFERVEDGTSDTDQN